MRMHRKPIVLRKWDNPLLLRTLRYIENQGGRLEGGKMDDLGMAVGGFSDLHTFRRCLRSMITYGIISRRRRPIWAISRYGYRVPAGTKPTITYLLIGYDEWLERGAGIVEAERARRVAAVTVKRVRPDKALARQLEESRAAAKQAWG